MGENPDGRSKSNTQNTANYPEYHSAIKHGPDCGFFVRALNYLTVNFHTCRFPKQTVKFVEPRNSVILWAPVPGTVPFSEEQNEHWKCQPRVFRRLPEPDCPKLSHISKQVSSSRLGLHICFCAFLYSQHLVECLVHRDHDKYLVSGSNHSQRAENHPEAQKSKITGFTPESLILGVEGEILDSAPMPPGTLVLTDADKHNLIHPLPGLPRKVLGWGPVLFGPRCREQYWPIS